MVIYINVFQYFSHFAIPLDCCSFCYFTSLYYYVLYETNDEKNDTYIIDKLHIYNIVKFCRWNKFLFFTFGSKFTRLHYCNILKHHYLQFTIYSPISYFLCLIRLCDLENINTSPTTSCPNTNRFITVLGFIRV